MTTALRIVTTILLAAACVGAAAAYAASTGEDRDKAQARGKTAGASAGAAQGMVAGQKNGKTVGTKAGRANGYNQVFKSARRTAYDRAYKKAYTDALAAERQRQEAAARQAEVDARVSRLRSQGLPACNDPDYLAGLNPGVCVDPSTGLGVD